MWTFGPLFTGLFARLPGLGLQSGFFPFSPPLDFFLPFACHLTSLPYFFSYLVQRDRPFHLCAGVEMDSSRSYVGLALAGPIFHISVVVARVKLEAMLTPRIALRDFGLRSCAQDYHAGRFVERNFRHH